MKVILLTDVKNIGKKHEVKEIANGYAQNFLIPAKRAVPATPAALARIKTEKEQGQKKNVALQAEVARALELLTGEPLRISVRANDKGHLYQALHVTDVVAAILEKTGVSVPIDKVSGLPEDKMLGSYTCLLDGEEVAIDLVAAAK